MTNSKDRVLAVLTDRDVDLPDDGLTLEKIRNRGTRFRIEEDDFLAFTLERHPTMYLSDSQLGRHQSPARFHIVTDYRLKLDEETWSVDEREATFQFDPHLVIKIRGEYTRLSVRRECSDDCRIRATNRRVMKPTR